MHKTKLFVIALGAMFALPALAEDAPAAPAAEPPPYTITANVGLTSDYTFRGISQNFRQPAIQGGFDFAHSSGFFVGTWASSISGNQYTNASMEWDVYGGYNGTINDELTYSLGLINVAYPNGQASATKKWDTTEWNIGATWKGLNVKYSQTLTDWFGINTAGFHPTMWLPTDTIASGATGSVTANGGAGAVADSRGSGYLEANYSYEVADKLVVSGHVGHQKIKNFDLLSYTDYKLGVTKDISGFVFGAAYTKTNASDNNLYDATTLPTAPNQQKKDLRGGILAVSVSRTF